MRTGQGGSRRSTRLLVSALAVAVSAPLMVMTAAPADAAPVVNPKAGKVVAKSAFDVKRDGFSFENWGPDDELHRRGLTVDGMRAVFGDGVCARITVEVCSPTTVAELLQQELNASMTGGHCYGMAALAGLYSTKRLNTLPLAMPWQSVYDMKPSAPLDELIARMFITQSFPPTARTEAELPASEILTRLRAAWARNDNYILGIYTDEKKEAGHAITPIAIRDLGAGKSGIVVYDNNFPGVEKMIIVDPAANSWFYSTATNPSEPTLLFEGSPANPMSLTPLSTALGHHEAPYVRGDYTLVMVSDTNGGARGEGDVEWDLRVTDLDGNVIPGVDQRILLNNDNTGSIMVPKGKKFRIVVDGVDAGRVADINTTVVSAGGAVVVDDMEVPAGATATLDVDPTRHAVTVRSTAPTTAGFEVATQDSLRSVTTQTSQLAIGPEAPVSVGATSRSGITVASQGRAQKVQFAVERSDTLTDRNAANHTPITVGSGGRIDVPVNTWTGWEPLTATVHSGGSTTAVPIPTR
ncbi:hypothetical protein [Gordonia sp. NPDC003376]